MTDSVQASSLPDRRIVVPALGTTQTLAWASSYYLPAIVGDPVSRDLGLSSNWFFALFSLALVIAGTIGPRVGRQIDAFGGRGVLSLSNVVIAIGLVLLGFANGLVLLALAWALLGVGMGLGLYDAAFAALGRLYGNTARGAITGITLFAGFASTIGWPLTAWGLEAIGWRDTCFAWAAVHIVLGLPLNLLCIPRTAIVEHQNGSPAKRHIPTDRRMLLIAFAFAAAWMVTGAMAVHLLRILEAAGATTVQAIAAGMLIGPAQVAARIAEASLLRRAHPLLSARLACVTHPVGVLVVLFGLGSLAYPLFAILHGLGNGVLTIARGTVPLAIFGPKDYGYRLGLLGAPARVLQALAPFVFGLLIEDLGYRVLLVSATLMIMALAALLLLHGEHHTGEAPT
ncbi:MAG: MFS transporter [Xanthobacteraceae bacterium]